MIQYSFILIHIITILAAMLLPALNQARERARGTQCLSQLKQIGIAVFLYCEDYDGYLMPIGHKMNASYVWTRQLADDRWLHFGPAYLEAKLFACPSATRQFKSGESLFVNPSYAYNRRLISGWFSTSDPSNMDYRSAKLSSYPKPSFHILHVDAFYNSDPTIGYFRFDAKVRNSNVYYATPEGRHSGRCNSLRLDGHVNSLPIPTGQSAWGVVPFSDWECDEMQRRY